MTNSSEPLVVSIITPSYNQASFVEETILSVGRQDYPHVEHIIVDGGSSDGTLDIIQIQAQRFPERIRWVSEPDDGQADAINKGFAMARGHLVAWLNSDDAYLYPHTISEVVAAFRRMPGVDVIYGDAILISEDNRLLKVLCTPRFDYSWLLRGCRLIQPSVFLRRQVVEVEALDPSIAIVLDYEYWLRLGQRYHFAHVPRLWAADRNHPARKILAQRGELVRHIRSLQRQYGQEFDMAHTWRRRRDSMQFGLPAMVRGLIALTGLYRARTATFAIPIRLDPGWQAVWRQLVKKNKDLV